MGAPWLTGALAATGSALEGLGLLVEIQHEPWIGTADAYNKPAYGAPVILRAMVQEGSQQIRDATKEEVTVRACVCIFDPIPPNGAPGRREPIDPRDRITLESGYTGPIVENDGSQRIAAPWMPAGSTRPVHVLWLK
jgi:hypothetical protein